MYETRGYPVDPELRRAHRAARRRSRLLAALRTLAAAALRSDRIHLSPRVPAAELDGAGVRPDQPEPDGLRL
jgi:hypothetical protein